MARCGPVGVVAESCIHRGAPCLVSCPGVAILKFLMRFEHRALRIHFTLGPENDAVSPAMTHAVYGQDQDLWLFY